MKLVNLATGADYALTPGENFKDRLPKRYASECLLTVDGSPVVAPVTINRGWSGDAEKTLTYPWLLISGRCYYVTLAPGESLEGEFAVLEGKATRVNPKRETVKVETEAARIARFRETWKARNESAPAAEPAPAAA